jgi:hypothetical protein
MTTLVIKVDKKSSLTKLLELAKKLRLKTKVVETKTETVEHDEWMELSAQGFVNYFSDDEPDINHIILKEPNPGYGAATGL